MSNGVNMNHSFIFLGIILFVFITPGCLTDESEEPKLFITIEVISDIPDEMNSVITIVAPDTAVANELAIRYDSISLVNLNGTEFFQITLTGDDNFSLTTNRPYLEVNYNQSGWNKSTIIHSSEGHSDLIGEVFLSLDHYHNFLANSTIDSEYNGDFEVSIIIEIGGNDGDPYCSSRNRIIISEFNSTNSAEALQSEYYAVCQ